MIVQKPMKIVECHDFSSKRIYFHTKNMSMGRNGKLVSIACKISPNLQVLEKVELKRQKCDYLDLVKM